VGQAGLVRIRAQAGVCEPPQRVLRRRQRKGTLASAQDSRCRPCLHRTLGQARRTQELRLPVVAAASEPHHQQHLCGMERPPQSASGQGEEKQTTSLPLCVWALLLRRVVVMRKPRPRTARSTFAIGLTLSSAAGCPERWYESRQPSVATAKPSEKTAPVTGRSVTPRQSTAAIGQAIAERLFRGLFQRLPSVSGCQWIAKRRSRHRECEPLSRGRSPGAWWRRG